MALCIIELLAFIVFIPFAVPAFCCDIITRALNHLNAPRLTIILIEQVVFWTASLAYVAVIHHVASDSKYSMLEQMAWQTTITVDGTWKGAIVNACKIAVASFNQAIIIGAKIAHTFASCAIKAPVGTTLHIIFCLRLWTRE